MTTYKGQVEAIAVNALREGMQVFYFFKGKMTIAKVLQVLDEDIARVTHVYEQHIGLVVRPMLSELIIVDGKYTYPLKWRQWKNFISPEGHSLVYPIKKVTFKRQEASSIAEILPIDDQKMFILKESKMWEVISEVMNLGMRLRQEQLKSDKTIYHGRSENEVLMIWFNDFKQKQ